jgi:hypothetical protein
MALYHVNVFAGGVMRDRYTADSVDTAGGATGTEIKPESTLVIKQASDTRNQECNQRNNQPNISRGADNRNGHARYRCAETDLETAMARGPTRRWAV